MLPVMLINACRKYSNTEVNDLRKYLFGRGGVSVEGISVCKVTEKMFYVYSTAYAQWAHGLELTLTSVRGHFVRLASI